jgi:hypothetical protein
MRRWVRRLAASPSLLRVGKAELEITEIPDRFDAASYRGASSVTSEAAQSLASYILGDRLWGSKGWPMSGHSGPLICELGSGTGAVGIACATVGARVLLTERADLISLIEENAARNQERIAAVGGAIRVEKLDWSSDADLQKVLYSHRVKPFDLLIGADLIHPSATSHDFSNLIKVAQSIPANRVVFAYQDKQGCAREFFRVARSLGVQSKELHVDEARETTICELVLKASSMDMWFGNF